MNWKNIKQEYPEKDGLIIYTDGHGVAKCAFHVGYGFSQHQILYKNGTESVDFIRWCYIWELLNAEI